MVQGKSCYDIDLKPPCHLRSWFLWREDLCILSDLIISDSRRNLIRLFQTSYSTNQQALPKSLITDSLFLHQVRRYNWPKSSDYINNDFQDTFQLNSFSTCFWAQLCLELNLASNSALYLVEICSLFTFIGLQIIIDYTLYLFKKHITLYTRH